MYQQLTTEARWAVLLTLIYLLGWVGFAYFSPQGRGIFGFPIWFELSCIFLPVLFSLVATIVVKKCIKISILR
ncbi:DUF997 family protein [Mannheimia haemolytica]